jgi:hypothetical protein
MGLLAFWDGIFEEEMGESSDMYQMRDRSRGSRLEGSR